LLTSNPLHILLQKLLKSMINSVNQKNKKNRKSLGWPLFKIDMVKELQHVIFYVHVHAYITVVPAILTRNETHCIRLRNSTVCIVVMFMLKRLCAVYTKLRF